METASKVLSYLFHPLTFYTLSNVEVLTDFLSSSTLTFFTIFLISSIENFFGFNSSILDS